MIRYENNPDMVEPALTLGCQLDNVEECGVTVEDVQLEISRGSKLISFVGDEKQLHFLLLNKRRYGKQLFGVGSSGFLEGEVISRMERDPALRSQAVFYVKDEARPKLVEICEALGLREGRDVVEEYWNNRRKRPKIKVSPSQSQGRGKGKK